MFMQAETFTNVVHGAFFLLLLFEPWGQRVNMLRRGCWRLTDHIEREQLSQLTIHPANLQTGGGREGRES